MEKCQSIFGHKFEARYSKIPKSDVEMAQGTYRVLKEILDASIEHVYERDICVRCGLVVKK